MAPAVFVMQSCGMCFSVKRMRSAIIFEARRRYWSALGGNMRFNYFLYSKYSKICYRSKHKLVEKLVEEVDGYGLSNMCNRPKVLDKVSVMMGYDGLPDLIENGTDCFDVSLVRNRFPSIIVGSSPPVSLYDGTWDLCDMRSLLAVKGYEDFLSNSTSKEQMLNSLNETWDSPVSTISSVETSSSRECYSYTTPLVSEPITLVPEENLNQPVTLEGSYALESQVDETPIELFLDKAISCIQGLRKKHCHQLEDAGFHTFRKVLHHFPRTYADLRNAQMGIEDGQYLIFIGKIVSSRGVRANSSFSFLEVVVSCDIANCDSNSENRVDSTDIEGNKTIYLHLKKFFRGTRYTFKPFLKSLQQKHKEGDIVCVSGKVRTMHMKNHYEIREYNIDVLEDGKESSFHAEGRPYPIYPSKGGLKPTFLRDIIPRFVPFGPSL